MPQKHIMQHLCSWLTVFVLPYSLMSAPCSHKCYPHNNIKMGVSYIILKSICFLRHLLYLHAHSTSLTDEQVATQEGPWSSSASPENEKQCVSLVSHKHKGVTFTVTRHSHSARQVPCYILAPSETENSLNLYWLILPWGENKLIVRSPYILK